MNRLLFQSQGQFQGQSQAGRWIAAATTTLSTASLCATTLVASMVSLNGLMPLPAIAQATALPSGTIPNTIRFSPPTDLPDPPPDTGDASGRVAGGRRGCNESGTLTNGPAFTVLVPQSKTGAPSFPLGRTTADHPTIWLHSKRGIKNGAIAVMSFQSDAKTPAQKVNFQLPKTAPGILRLSVPSSAPTLVAGKAYRWKLEIYCHSGVSTDGESTLDVPETLNGGIQRLAPSPTLQRQLATTKTPLEQAKLYAKYGIWYDSLTTLGKQLQGKSVVDPAIARAWSDLLRQGNLETVTTAPIVSCCGLKP